MRKIDFEAQGLIKLHADDLIQIVGGSDATDIPDWLKKLTKGATVFGVLTFLNDHWSDLEKGLVEGWKAANN